MIRSVFADDLENNFLKKNIRLGQIIEQLNKEWRNNKSLKKTSLEMIKAFKLTWYFRNKMLSNDIHHNQSNVR